MDMDATLTRLEAVLRAERDAIVRFDGEALEHSADEKMGLLAAIEGGPPTGPADAARYEALRTLFRYNLALLSRGRACLREAIATFSLGPSDPLGSARSGAPAHVTG